MTLMTKTVSDLMQASVVEVDPEASVASVVELAREKKVHHFPLVRRGSLLGVVCSCDIDDAPRRAPVSRFARRDVVTVAPETKLRDAARQMLRRVVGSVVVMRGTYVCGLLTREDLVREDPGLAELFKDQRCSACGAAKHLRPWRGAGLLCAACAERVGTRSRLDLGGGD